MSCYNKKSSSYTHIYIVLYIVIQLPVARPKVLSTRFLYFKNTLGVINLDSVAEDTISNVVKINIMIN